MPIKPPGHAGWLVKRGSVVKNWKRRWFALERDGLVLAYYKHKGDKRRAGAIDAVSVQTVVCGADCGGIWPPVAEIDLAFALVTPKRTYYVYCESRDECVAWMHALRRACRLGDVALPVGAPLIDGEDAAVLKERFVIRTTVGPGATNGHVAARAQGDTSGAEPLT